MEGLTEGRIVHFVMPNQKHRPAVVVNANPSEQDGLVNLQIFVDGLEEVFPGKEIEPLPVARDCTIWMASIAFSAEMKPGTWHWIEKA